jgi:hypothetical protein
MPTYLRFEPGQREMVERWVEDIRKRLKGTGEVEVQRVLARDRHLELANSPAIMQPQRFARLQAEVADIQGEGAFLLVVDCGETGTRATRFVRRFETLEALQEGKRRIDAERCGPGCWRNHLLYRLAHPSEEAHGSSHPARSAW